MALDAAVRDRPSSRSGRSSCSRSCPTAASASSTTARSATRPRAARRSASGGWSRRSTACRSWRAALPVVLGQRLLLPAEAARPSSRSPRSRAALLIATQVGSTHWFYFFILWWTPLRAGQPRSPPRSGSRRPVRAAGVSGVDVGLARPVRRYRWRKRPQTAAAARRQEAEMKYMLTMFGEGGWEDAHARGVKGGMGPGSPTPRRYDAGALHRRRGPAGERHRDDRASRASRGHRRPLRRDQGAARRLLPDRVRGPRRGARVGEEGPDARRRGRGPPGHGLRGAGAEEHAPPKARPRRRRSSRRPPVPARVGAGGRDADPRPRRLRRRRGGGPGGVRRRARALAADGIPDNPGAWITRVARNKAIDRLRREAPWRASAELEALELGRAPEELGRRATRRKLPDDRLRLIFTCCHPALAPEARIALTLRTLGGLTHRGDRPRVPRRRGDDGPAARPGQAQDPRRRDPLRGAGRERSASGSPRCWRRST